MGLCQDRAALVVRSETRWHQLPSPLIAQVKIATALKLSQPFTGG